MFNIGSSLLMSKLMFYFLAIGLGACSVTRGTRPPDRTPLPSEPPRQTDPRLRSMGNVPPGPKSYVLDCLNETVCWTGDFLKQWRTNDGGKNWQLVYSGSPNGGEITTIDHIGEHVAWVLTIEKLYKTEDGASWVEQAKPLPDYPSGQLRAIRFMADGMIGWAGGGIFRPLTSDEQRNGVPRNISDPASKTVLRPAISRTEDGGKTWNPQSLPSTTGRVYDFAFLNEQQGIALESSGPFYTENGGREWKRVDFKKSCTNARYLEGYDMRAIQVFFLDSHNVWMSFEDGRIAKSVNGGQSWCDLLAPNAVNFDYNEKYFKKIHFTTLLQGWGLGANRNLYETTDGGKTWAKALDIELDDLFFMNNGTVFLVSKAGLFRMSF